MDLLKLVIVDDEPILLKGLLKTYEWDKMGFRVVGTAQSGEQAVQVIGEQQPDVVLTDIRMKQMTGLGVMEEIRNRGQECLFIVLSAYRDFEYAQQACDLGAFAYLLKPIEDEKLQETMQNAYRTCMERRSHAERFQSWENLVKKDSTSFLQVIVQKYLQDQLSYEKMAEVFETVGQEVEREDRFIALCAGIDLAYKITNELEYEASRFALKQFLEEHIGRKLFSWSFENEKGTLIFIVKTKENATVRLLKQLLTEAGEEQHGPIVGSISKPYKGLQGIRRAYEEASELFDKALVAGNGTFTVCESSGEDRKEKAPDEEALLLAHALRKNDEGELKEAFVKFIYALPANEEQQRQKLHSVMLDAEVAVEASYGMTGELKKQFQSYYSNMQNLSPSKEVDVCYRILESAIRERKAYAENHELLGGKEYMNAALAYIDGNLSKEDLSIVEVAMHVYLNPVYFGRVFKETVQMPFKKYLLQCRMEKAKRILQNGGAASIGSICEQIGISNPSYFSHLFKEYTGKLPTEYKKEFEV